MDLPETRDSLIAQIQDPENGAAWDAFAHIYRPVVVRLARSRGLQAADAEDLAQQVLLSVARAVPNWERSDGSRFRNWLGRIARNAILNALTRGPRELAGGGSDFLAVLRQFPHDDNQLARQIELEYRRQVYRRAAAIVRDAVDEPTWRAFLYCVVEGEETSAVAERLGKTIGNVHAARSRIMRRLQTVASELMEADE